MIDLTKDTEKSTRDDKVENEVNNDADLTDLERKEGFCERIKNSCSDMWTKSYEMLSAYTPSKVKELIARCSFKSAKTTETSGNDTTEEE